LVALCDLRILTHHVTSLLNRDGTGFGRFTLTHRN